MDNYFLINQENINVKVQDEITNNVTFSRKIILF